MSYTLKKSQTHCVVLAARSADPKEAAPQPRATMATVAMTSDLEPYLASLRSYLTQSRPPHQAEADSEDSATETPRLPERRTVQREQASSKGGRDNSRAGPRRSTVEDPPCSIC
ncbi:uncharacterized protein BO95DRAFT_466481 [Aspergillus brunneoviolaceus CBS 621.78]|uniref:Uncharacterized protein n=1 Tax=Aspergillus brunneoviolaceus CBS 621.78 TaxID=1450534 RepID=A0ACD1G0X1_9EURO|nr:hypothetical protein BO95DRAFT_466481 [Aspergillus brunneoviolaceus CBS 621.78]RAH42879.1 hypothetical protein BO95DRAFT_466481 [Aspergillus brunneoviolaceus CBS 621.78]